jgi:hypothetical protein
MDDGSAQCGALGSCSCLGRERGFVRWGWLSKCVAVQGGRGNGYGCECVERLRVLPYYGYVSPATAFSLMRATADGSANVVDVYNSATGAWTTAQLSEARGCGVAVSVGNVALFAGGQISSALFFRQMVWEN